MEQILVPAKRESHGKVKAFVEHILEVADQGIGMTKEQIAHVKEAFYRVDKSRSRAAGGAGLGLSICERIVELHRGRLEFVSQPGEGTVARVFLSGENGDRTDFR